MSEETSYRWIGVGWLIHAGWDIAHHSMIAPWFLAGAPSFLKRPHAAMRAAGA